MLHEGLPYKKNLQNYMSGVGVLARSKLWRARMPAPQHEKFNFWKFLTKILDFSF